jgi:WD40 repeat protein
LQAKTLRGVDSNVTQAVFLQGDTLNWEKPLLPLLLTCYNNGTVAVWNVNKGEIVWKVEKEQTSCVAVHPSLDHFAVGAVSGPVHIYSSKDWAVKATFQIASAEAVAPMKMAYVAVKDVKTTSWWLLVGVSNGDVEVLDAGKEYTRLGHLKGSALSSLTAMDVGTSGVIAVCGKSGDVGVWMINILKKEFAKGESPAPHILLNRREPVAHHIPMFEDEEIWAPQGLLRRLPLFSVDAPRYMCWLPQHSSHLAVACGHQVELWDLTSKIAECTKNYGTWRAPDSGYTLSDPSKVLVQRSAVQSLVPSGEYLVIGDRSGCIQVWSIKDGVSLQQFQDHKGAIKGLFGDPFRMVSCSTDFSLRVYRWKDNEGKKVLESKYTLLGGSVAMKSHDGFNAVLCSLNCCIGIAGKLVKVYIFGS